MFLSLSLPSTLALSWWQKNNAEPVTGANRYTVAFAAVSFCLTLVVVVMHLLPTTVTMIVGTQIEGIVLVVLLAFWTAILSLNIDAGNTLVSKEAGSDAVQSANFYYFTWLGWITAIVLLVGFVRDAFGLDLMGELRGQSARMQWWAALFACAFVVMASAARANHKDCPAKGSHYCRKTKFAISVGSLGVIFALLVIGSKVVRYTSDSAITPFLLEFGVTGILLILSGFNVFFATSANAPASAIGNLYYFSWLLFGSSFVIATECYGENRQPAAEEENKDGNNRNGNGSDIEVETFDDAI
jgi:hypothetical protein